MPRRDDGPAPTAPPPVFVLAAGLGTRLGFHSAKTLFPVAGRPILDWILAECERQGVREVVVTVLHHHLRALREFRDARGGSGVELSLSVDDAPQGTLGTLRRAWAGRPCERFFVWLGDIIGRPPLRALERAGRLVPAVLLAHRRRDYENSGVVTVGGGRDHRSGSYPVSDFHEKPGRLGLAEARVWAGVAALHSGALDGCQGDDLGRDLWPKLAREGRCRTVDSDGSAPLMAVERPADGARVVAAAAGGTVR